MATDCFKQQKRGPKGRGAAKCNSPCSRALLKRPVLKFQAFLARGYRSGSRYRRCMAVSIKLGVPLKGLGVRVPKTVAMLGLNS